MSSTLPAGMCVSWMLRSVKACLRRPDLEQHSWRSLHASQAAAAWAIWAALYTIKRCRAAFSHVLMADLIGMSKHAQVTCSVCPHLHHVT